jgi:hypothetical protein
MKSYLLFLWYNLVGDLMKLNEKEVDKYIALIIIVLFSALITFTMVYCINEYGDNYVEEK